MSTISAGTTTPTALSLSGDTTGALTFQVNGTTTAATISSAGNVSLATGNLTFSSTGQRITGDMSNATVANRLALQNSVTNGASQFLVIPNGTSTTSQINLESDSAVANGTIAQFIMNGTTDVRIASSIRGSGTYAPMAFYTGGSERMRIDTSGNVGIGTASPAAKLDIGSGNLNFSSTAQRITGDMSNATVSNRLAFQTSTTNSATRLMAIPNGTSTVTAFNVLNSSDPNNASWLSIGVSNIEAVINATISGTGTYLPMTFATGGSERMRLDTSGNLGIGTASPGERLSLAGAANVYSSISTTGGIKNQLFSSDATGGGGIGTVSNHFLAFYTNNTERMRITTGGEVYIAGTTDQGAYNLQCNGTGVWGAGAYVNGSDARLKDNIQSLDAGLDVVKAMRPVTFQYKPDYSKDQSVQPGFIAQELQTAMAGKPYLEGVVQEGTNHLNVAYQSIIPILVKAMQEQQDQIKALQDKIAALESK